MTKMDVYFITLHTFRVLLLSVGGRAIGTESSCRGSMDQFRHGREPQNGLMGGPCKFLEFSNKTVTKRAREHDKLSADFMWETETSVYERINAVKRPRGCEQFFLFPKLVSTNRSEYSFTTERFGMPIECKDSAYVTSTCCDVSP